MHAVKQLPITLPDFRGSHPFSKGKPVYYRLSDLKDSVEGQTARTHFFEKQLVGIFYATGHRPVPYAFKTTQGEVRSLDAGCLKFLLNRRIAEISVKCDPDGFIIAVEPLAPLLTRFAEVSHRLVKDVGGPTSISSELPFSLDDPVDERRRSESERVIRDGAALFRERVLKAWSGQCAVTGVSVASVLEAAHIFPYLGSLTNDVRNGIALRSDIHMLFDQRLLSFEQLDGELSVQVSRLLFGSEYASLAGRTLKLPESEQERPTVDLLVFLESRFGEAEAERDAPLSDHRSANSR